MNYIEKKKSIEMEIKKLVIYYLVKDNSLIMDS